MPDQADILDIDPVQQFCALRARCHQLSVPRVRRSIFGTRAFSVARRTVWISLPDHLWDPAVDSKQFRCDLKYEALHNHAL